MKEIASSNMYVNYGDDMICLDAKHAGPAHGMNNGKYLYYMQYLTVTNSDDYFATK